MTKLFKNVVAQHSSGSNAANTFFSGQGDVLITYESEAYAAFAAGKQGKLIVPKPTMLIQLPMVATQERPGARPRRSSSTSTAPKQQTIFAANGYRPVVKSVLKSPTSRAGRRSTTPARPSTSDDKSFGGWRKVEQRLVRPEQGPDGQDRAGGRRTHQLARSPHRATAPSRRVSADGRASTGLSVGVISTYLLVIVVLPIAALVWEAKKSGAHGFWQAVSSPEAVGALEAHVRRGLHRRLDQRRAGHDHGLGPRPRRLPRASRSSTR